MGVACLAEVVGAAAEVDIELKKVRAAQPGKILDELINAVRSVAWSDVADIGEQLIALPWSVDSGVNASVEMGVG